MALRLARVLGLEQQPHLDRRQRRVLERARSLDDSPGSSSRRSRGRPPDRNGASWCRPASSVDVALDAGGADDPARRHGQPDVVDAEVGEELGAVWNWWQFQPPSSSTPIFGNHCAMK